MKNWILYSILLMVFAMSSTANAGLLTYEFGGVVSNVIDVDSSGLVNTTGIDTTTTFTGTLVYDTAAADQGGPPGTRSYDAGVLNVVFDTGTMTYAAGADESIIQITDNNSLFRDSYAQSVSQFISPSAFTELPLVPGAVLWSMQLRLTDTSQTLYSDASLPTSLALSEYDIATVSFLAGKDTFTGADYEIIGDLTSLTLTTPVPEPSALGLLGVGLLGLGLARRKKRA